LVATIDKKVLFQKDRIEKVFKVLDADNSGSLTLPEVRDFLKNLNIPD
jgi:Ca2+-binding EF-hand superfamily protein